MPCRNITAEQRTAYINDPEQVENFKCSYCGTACEIETTHAKGASFVCASCCGCAVLDLLDSTTRALLDARVRLVYEFSGDIRGAKLKALDEINATRERASLPLLTREDVTSWEGEFDND